MAFLAPYMLWGALAAGIPIALHFFFRSRYRTVPWAAMKFLLTSIEQTSRRLKFQELLLLAMRVALLVLLALALARPVSSVMRGTGGGDAIDAVFVVDTSFSMGGSDGAKTRLERARDEAARIIDELPPHSTVQIITCARTAEPKVLGPRSPANLDQAKELLKEISLTSLATDLFPGANKGAEVLKLGQASNKEFYVFSDMQKAGWERQGGRLSQLLHDLKETATINLVHCGKRALKNVAILGITSQSGAPRPGERVGFAVVIKNTGTEPLENLKVSLQIDGDEKAVETQAVDRLEPGETRTVALTGRLEKPGLRVLTARVIHDDLDGDNRFDQVLLVREQVNILIVDGNYNEREPAKSSSFLLAHALIPVEDTQRARYHLQPRYVTPRLASPALLGKQDICILVNVALQAQPGRQADVLPADFVTELGRFVRNGKALVIYAGDNVAADPYNRLLGKKEHLLPLPIKGIFKTAANEPVKINRDTFKLPAFWKFRDDNDYKNFNAIRVYQGLEVAESERPGPKSVEKPAGEEKKPEDEEKKNDPVTIALRYSDGRPAIVSRKVDSGEVILITTAADVDFDAKTSNPTWSDWPLFPVNPPFVQGLVGHLLQGQTQTYNLVAGEPLNWYPTERTTLSYTLIDPERKATRLGVPEKVGARSRVISSDLNRAGIYRLVTSQPRSDENSAEPSAALSTKDAGTPLAVIPDLRESEDLSSFTKDQLDERLKFTPIHIVAGDESSRVGTADRLNREWTLWLLAAVLVVLIGEGALAYWCGKAW